MLSLDSKHYEKVLVVFKDETVVLPPDSGVRLMQYLTSDNVSSHVMLTDTSGVQIVVNKHDIKKITPVVRAGELDQSRYV